MPLPPRRHDRPFIRAVLHIVAAAALVLGIWKLNTTVHFMHRAVRTTGHVVARTGDPNATDSGAHPDVIFTDLTGAAIRYNQNGMGSRRVGTPLPVLYDPAAPADTAVVDSFWQIWDMVLFPFWIAISFTAAALWADVYSNWDNYLARRAAARESAAPPGEQH